VPAGFLVRHEDGIGSRRVELAGLVVDEIPLVRCEQAGNEAFTKQSRLPISAIRVESVSGDRSAIADQVRRYRDD
jgi:hypothetical protein